MRTIDASVLREMLAPQTGNTIVPLLQINHSTLTSPFYFAGDYNDVVYNGQTYTAFPFEILLPNDTDETIPQVRLLLDNVGQDLVNLIRGAGDSPKIQVTIVNIDPSGTVTKLLGPLDFSLLAVSYDVSTIEMTLGYESDILNSPATKDIFDPGIAPGLFKV